MKIRDYAIFIISYGRPKFLKIKTWNYLNKVNSSAKRFIICSDDDSSLQEYKDVFGEENIIVFNKEDAEREIKIDLCDAFGNSSKKGTVWVRNYQYKIARKLGYRYFMVWDDDVQELSMREVVTKNNKEKLTCIQFKNNDFDNICELYFRILDSAPWLYTLAFAQGGDFIGGFKSVLYLKGYRFKAMNCFFFDTEKEERFYGRLNDDVNSYVLNGSRGMISLTFPFVSITQTTTQQYKNGMTDIYKTFGTYIKSLYTIIINPSNTYIDMIGQSIETRRIHHLVYWENSTPKIVDESYCKGKYDYSKVLKEKYKEDENGEIIEVKEHSFLECDIIEDYSLSNRIDDFF